MKSRRRWWQPPYELWLVVDEARKSPVLVWSRHRIRALAARSKRLDEASIDLGQARLVLHDRRTPPETSDRRSATGRIPRRVPFPRREAPANVATRHVVRDTSS